jgi:hypothetical protein
MAATACTGAILAASFEDWNSAQKVSAPTKTTTSSKQEVEKPADVKADETAEAPAPTGLLSLLSF